MVEKTNTPVNENGVTIASDKHVRFSDLIWYDPNYLSHITIGGAGGIGSWVALALSRMGYKLHIFDPDTVDTTNLGGQLYGEQSVGIIKSTATATLCAQLGASQRIIADVLYAGQQVALVTVSAFDNMKARKALFEQWKKHKQGLFIDGRMLAESGQVYYVRGAYPDDIVAYEATLFDDSEVKDQPCSAKATTHCGMRIATEIVTGVTNFVTNQMLKSDVREVPFRREFQLALFYEDTQTVEQCMPQLSTI